MNNAGRFDTPCKVWEYSVTQNAFGEPVYTWAEAIGAPKWCRVEPLRGWEKFASQQVVAQGECKVVIRRWADLHVTHEIEFRGERWQLVSVEDHGRGGISVLHVQIKS